MGHIPKSAQRAIDKANRDRAKMARVRDQVAAQLPVPRVMAHGMTPQSIMNLFDVYLDGERQHLCTLANVDKGLIRRWCRGHAHLADKTGGQEEVYGKVEIRRKGA